MLSVIWGGYTPKPVLPLANAPAEGPSAVLPHHLNVRVTRLGSEVVSRVGAVDPTPKERTNWHEMHILYDSLRSGEKTIWGETLDGKKVNIIFDEPGMAELLMRQFSGRVQKVGPDRPCRISLCVLFRSPL
ncbi:hypothetical protein FOZ62_019501, partial [Perkinsus olseni]